MISSVPLPWCTSRSMIATRLITGIAEISSAKATSAALVLATAASDTTSLLAAPLVFLLHALTCSRRAACQLCTRVAYADAPYSYKACNAAAATLLNIQKPHELPSGNRVYLHGDQVVAQDKMHFCLPHAQHGPRQSMPPPLRDVQHRENPLRTMYHTGLHFEILAGSTL